MYFYNSKQEHDQLIETEAPKFVQTLEQIIEFKKWRFKQTFAGFPLPSPWTWRVIYDSEWCRVCFSWDIPDPREYPVSHVSYGRLHAPSNEEIIMWNGKKCYCWHDIRKALFFLDGKSWQDLAKEKFKLPDAEENFRQARTGKGWSQPEWMARMHLAFWEQYDKKLFELFDLRHPDLWEKYTKFLEEYHKFSDYPPVAYPSRYEVC